MAKQTAPRGGRIGTGGSIERDLVRRWARRQRPYASDTQRLVLDRLIGWLAGQPGRTKRKGGIGR